MGPEGTRSTDVYLRTAVSVEPKGWAHFDYVKMPDYRWGIFLAPAEPGRKVNFGAHKGEPAWQEVPGEYRANLRRLIVTQGDTEPASVEQQRLLGLTCPSLYDLRNLFQVNVEEGRHLWAMVYLLHAYFGRDGREEAEALLERRSGDADNPRILGAFNEPHARLAVVLHVHVLHRPRRQVPALLARRVGLRSARAHVPLHADRGGAPHVRRRVRHRPHRAAHVRGDDRAQDRRPAKLRAQGVIDLPTIQRYLNFHFSVTMDLFGSDVSSNAATFYTTGLKGRFDETKIDDDHLLAGATYPVLEIRDGRLATAQAPALNALNEKLRDDFIRDAAAGIERWNRVIEKHGIPFRLKAPHKAFHRRIGPLAAARIDSRRHVVSPAEWAANADAVAAERR